MAASVHVIPDAVQILPACQHLTASVHIIPGAVHISPAGEHMAASVHVIPDAVQILPAGEHLTAPVHVVPDAAYFLPAGLHLSFLVQIIPAAADPLPARLHLAAGAHIIPDAADLLPAGHHPARRVKVIPAAVNIFPLRAGITAVPVLIPPAAAGTHPVSQGVRFFLRFRGFCILLRLILPGIFGRLGNAGIRFPFLCLGRHLCRLGWGFQICLGTRVLPVLRLLAAQSLFRLVSCRFLSGGAIRLFLVIPDILLFLAGISCFLRIRAVRKSGILRLDIFVSFRYLWGIRCRFLPCFLLRLLLFQYGLLRGRLVIHSCLGGVRKQK